MSSTDIQAIAPGVFELERGDSGAETQVKAGLTHFEIQKYCSLTSFLCLDFI